MSVNVKCKGFLGWHRDVYGQWFEGTQGPCGWTGQAHGIDSVDPYEIEGVRIDPHLLVARLHCPNCHGWVRLVLP